MTVPVLRIGKCWQTPELQMVWQLQASGPVPDGLPKKFHLIVDVRQQTRGVRFDRGKPENGTAQMALPSLVRKHLPHGEISDIRRYPDGTLVILCGHRDEPPWQLRLSHDRPPVLSLVMPDLTTLIRLGAQGAFTKRQPASELGEQSESVMGELWQAFVRPASTRESAQPSEPPMNSEQRDLLRRLRRKLKTVRKSLAKTAGQVASTDALEQLQRQCQVLAAHVHEIPHGATTFTAETGDETPMAITVELDGERSPGENLDGMYHQLKRLQRSQQLGAKRDAETRHEITVLEAAVSALEGAPHSQIALADMARKFGLGLRVEPSGRIPLATAKPYREYCSRDGKRIYVGKSAGDNDALTKSARANDLWFHVAGMTGSHVIVPFQKGPISPQTERQAAILALHHSPLRKDLSGEVYRTPRRFLRKKKGLAPGLWLIDQSTTVFVRYTQEEADEILQTQLAGP